MGHWFSTNIVEPGKLPMFLALASFVLTFLITRVITRMIRAGRGPFRNIASGEGCTSTMWCPESSSPSWAASAPWAADSTASPRPSAQ